ncbi:unnamed protein product [Diabrotica balteata]|uniref:DNA/RNA non-specific endonuclease/pyrophosphatase/phosphodiesterase domain-containing protein n=1 Tax=Diabrotica balteata TaxID=107213 RepID=A0A9N9XJ85_DIABA|nr:unnamed protein product [Diabrotica balteata]
MALKHFSLLGTMKSVLVILVVYLLSVGNCATTGCEINPFGSNTPLVVKYGTTSLIEPTPGYSTLSFTRNALVEFACPGTQITKNGTSLGALVTATCKTGDVFTINGHDVHWSYLSCHNVINPTVREITRNTDTNDPNNQCVNNNKKLQIIQIGFALSTNRFTEAMTICFDSTSKLAIYTYFVLSASINYRARNVANPSFSQDDTFYRMGRSVNTMYQNIQTTYNTLVGLESTSTQYVNRSIFPNRGHLAAKADFVYEPHQRATYRYLRQKYYSKITKFHVFCQNRRPMLNIDTVMLPISSGGLRGGNDIKRDVVNSTGLGCNIYPMQTKAPLTINPTSNTLIYPLPGEYSIRLAPNSQVEFSCPESRIAVGGNVGSNVITATCEENGAFKIPLLPEDQVLDYSSLKCISEPVPTVRKVRYYELNHGDPNINCHNKLLNNLIILKIGFRIDSFGRYLNHIDVCFDIVDKIPVYSHYNISAATNSRAKGFQNPYFIQDENFYELNSDLYRLFRDVKYTVNDIVGLNYDSGKYINGDIFINKGHLAAKADFVYEPLQKATYRKTKKTVKYPNSLPAMSPFPQSDKLLIQALSES